MLRFLDNWYRSEWCVSAVRVERYDDFTTAFLIDSEAVRLSARVKLHVSSTALDDSNRKSFQQPYSDRLLP